MKKMYRVMLTAAAAGLLLFTGCGKEKESEPETPQNVEISVETEDAGTTEPVAEEKEETAGEVDIKSIGDALRNEITYQDELSALDLETAAMFLSFGDARITDAVIFESTGATAEEIVVLSCASEADAKEAVKALDNRIEEQKEAYEDYVPEELKKLSHPVIRQKGTVAVLSVSDEPEKAEEILGNYLP